MIFHKINRVCFPGGMGMAKDPAKEIGEKPA
ncbi:MAG: hypothetical protein H6Q81_1055, partial [Deltaproteobacteria bacterium]|nr:hypothetical protein [Deltaproteobacteria bacterium]